MKRLTTTLLSAALIASLTACTGTEEDPPPIRLVVLTDAGATLRAVTPAPENTIPPVTENASVAVNSGISVDTPPSGTRIIVTLAARAESRDANLTGIQPFAALPTDTFPSVCLTRSAINATRDRLLVLSECSGSPQQLALYRENGTLVWTARLPTFVPPAPNPDNPPVRLGVLRDASGFDIGVVARPIVGGGSEVMRVAQEKLADTVAVVSTPIPTTSIRDLAPYGSGLLAATDSGLRPLTATGEPENNALPAFGTARYDRLWTGSTGNRNLTLAWRNNLLTASGGEPLLVWDGQKASAVNVGNTTFNDLRDLTVAPNGYLYTLTRTTLSQFDTVYGLQQGSWRNRDLLTGLNEARAVSWVVPPSP